MSFIKDSVYGFVVGDAIGVPIEFEDRKKLMNNPVTSMKGYGSYDVPEGTWSDDTSMTLATMDSIIQQKGKINYNDMADKFCNWLNNADYTATNEVFDIGITTKYALIRYWDDKSDATTCGGTDLNENGNGSLMRMLPIALYCYYKKLKDIEILEIVKKASSITHAHEISIMGCYIYVRYIMFILYKKDKYASYSMIKCLDYNMFSKETKDVYARIINSDISKVELSSIKSSGYIVDTLETVLWVILNCNSYNESIIGAINLGGDTDTIGAITGSIAGLLYGYNKISDRWINKLKNRKLLDTIIENFEQVLSSEDEFIPDCPKCGNKMIKKIYGMPDSEIGNKVMNGEIFLGGCLESDIEPLYHCNKCRLSYYANLKDYIKENNNCESKDDII